MYYIISILLIITAIGLAIYGSKKYNVSLALAYVIPNLAFLYYIDDSFNGVPYMRYGYFTVLFFGVLVLLFAKIFTYIYSYFTLLFLLVLIWASSYSILNLNAENISSIEAWSIVLIALIVIILVRKSIKSIVIGMGSGYMLGIGIAALGFKSILNMGWEYIMDAIYFPGLTILIFTIAGIFYQFYLNKSEQENPDLSKKQVNLYFGAGAGIVAILLILLPLLLKTTSGTSTPEITMPEITTFEHNTRKTETNLSNSNIDKRKKDKNQKNEETHEQNQNNQIDNIKNYNKFLGRYIEDFEMNTVILAIESIDAQNGLAKGYVKTDYEDSQNLKGPFKVVNDNTDLRIAWSDNYTTYDFYVDGKTVKGDAKDRNGETMYSFSLSKMENSSSNESSKKTYYTIQDVDGYSNLRNRPNGEILKRVYESEQFEVIGSEGKYKKVKLNDGTIGYIHESRVVKVKSDNTQSTSANQNNQTVLLQTTKYKIRIDKLGNDNYTYTAWPASSSMNDTPNIVIKNGKRYEDGSGGNHYYTFMNGVYKYECWINVLGTDETPPANLLVYKKNDLILKEDVVIK